jgi:hypothetical protein
VLAELLDFFIVCDEVKANFSRYLPVHAKDGCDLFLCQKEDLKHELIAFFSAPAHARLTHQDDARQQDCLERHDRAEKGERRWIEVPREGERSCVEFYPSREDGQVKADERETTCETGDGIAKAFCCSAIDEEILFVFCDQINVLLNVILGHAYLDAGRGLLPTWAPTHSCTPLPLQFCAKSKNDLG